MDILKKSLLGRGPAQFRSILFNGLSDDSDSLKTVFLILPCPSLSSFQEGMVEVAGSTSVPMGGEVAVWLLLQATAPIWGGGRYV